MEIINVKFKGFLDPDPRVFTGVTIKSVLLKKCVQRIV